jgi:glutathionylspermidine synthase
MTILAEEQALEGSAEGGHNGAPWRAVDPLPPGVVATIRRRAIFECCKWDPQVEDVSTIADVPIVLHATAWADLVMQAERLADEVVAAEEELRRRPELHHMLGLPRAIRRVLARAHSPTEFRGVRFIRFDFHHTDAGWRISEANTDVPGGLNEASGLPRLVRPYVTAASTAGDVAGGYADAVLATLPEHPHIALIHATAYSDDRQVMTFIAKNLDERGARVSLVSPSHLRWHEGRAALKTDWTSGPVDAVLRFYPGEWMPNLPAACGWTSYFESTCTPVSNPATALLTQSKRFPLTWDSLRTPLPTWRALLPETRDPRDVRWQGSDEWVLKPALGRVGEDVMIAGVTGRADSALIERDVSRHPSHWVAQRRFVATPLIVATRERYPGIGVYTVDGRVVGAYGRLADRPLIDSRARDAAVLIGEETERPERTVLQEERR